MSRQTKKVDKQMELIKKQFRKNHMVMKKQKASMAKAKSAGRFVSSLKPEPWLTAFATFLIYAMPSGGGKTKKVLRSMLESEYPPEVWTEALPIYESLMEMENVQPLMEMEDVELLLENLVLWTEDFDSDGRLTVNKLNEEVENIKGKQLTVKEQMRLRFYKFLKLFEEKLASLNIVEDSEITKFLLSMTNAVHKVKIGNRVPMKKAVSKGNGKSLK